VNSFPTLSLEQVRGAIDYYSAHRAEVDQYLKRGTGAVRGGSCFAVARIFRTAGAS